MKLELDENNPKQIYLQIADQMELAIIKSHFGGDDFLPSVRDLAKENLVNPNTVAKAYAELRGRNLVESVRGKGLRVLEINQKDKQYRKNKIFMQELEKLLSAAEELEISESEIINVIKLRSKP